MGGHEKEHDRDGGWGTSRRRNKKRRPSTCVEQKKWKVGGVGWKNRRKRQLIHDIHIEQAGIFRRSLTGGKFVADVSTTRRRTTGHGKLLLRFLHFRHQNESLFNPFNYSFFQM